MTFKKRSNSTKLGQISFKKKAKKEPNLINIFDLHWSGKVISTVPKCTVLIGKKFQIIQNNVGFKLAAYFKLFFKCLQLLHNMKRFGV